MKFIGTNCFLCGREARIINEKTGGLVNHHNQFRIVCKARGIKHANELTGWIARNIFNYEYSSPTSNEIEISFFEKDSRVNFIIGRYDSYITDVQLREALELREKEQK